MSKSPYRIDKLDICKGLTAMDIQEIMKISTKVCYRKGDIITDASNKSRNVYVLIDGDVDIMSMHGVSLYRVSNGEIFGELAMVPNIKRSAVAVARSESWVFVVNINHLETLGEQYPDIYRKVYHNIIQSLGIKLARANKLIELLKTELTRSLKKR
ncbi:MAG: cyclic nucleotide-binding domain-containing protein [Candidatus Latescibacteria bacterium]|nr:cyclic nucleotide-binding domain-containing protein [Candidatus Latescibacterota bacterium]